MLNLKKKKKRKAIPRISRIARKNSFLLFEVAKLGKL